MPSSYLFLSIGHAIEGCLVLNGDVHKGGTERAGKIGSIPVRIDEKGTVVTVRDVSSFSILHERLLASGDHVLTTEDFYRAVHKHPMVVENWMKDASEAIFMGILAVQAVSDVDTVYLQIAPPNMIGEAMVGKIRMGFAALTNNDISIPDIHLSHSPSIAPALGAASIVLYEHFSPKLDRITDVKKSDGKDIAVDGSRIKMWDCKRVTKYNNKQYSDM